MEWQELFAESERLADRSMQLRTAAREMWARDMKTSGDLDQELGRILMALEILDPESDNSLITHLKSTSDRTQQSIEKLAQDLRVLISRLDAKQAAPLIKAAEAFGELARLPEWKKAEELSLMMRAATGRLEDNIKALVENEDS